jgi:predicted transcriptional regulator
MRHRTVHDITAKVLSAAAEGATKSNLMYTSFLSYGQLIKYIDICIENDLLTFDSQNRLFRTTEKGRRFLSVHQELKALAPMNWPRQKRSELLAYEAF